jgi:hypothetical protein
MEKSTHKDDLQWTSGTMENDTSSIIGITVLQGFIRQVRMEAARQNISVIFYSEISLPVIFNKKKALYV